MNVSARHTEQLLNLAAIVLAGAFAWASFTLLLTPSGRNDIPAWVQAIGSIAAILSTGWFLKREREHEARRKLSALAGVLQLALGLIEDAAQRTRQSYSPEMISFLLSYDRAHFDHAAGILDRVPLHELQSSDMAVAVHNTRIVLIHSAEVLDRAKRIMTLPPPGFIVDLSPQLEIVSEVRKTVIESWAKYGGE